MKSLMNTYARLISSVVLIGFILTLSSCNFCIGCRAVTPAGPEVTFLRAVGSTSNWSYEIFQASPSASTPEGQNLIAGINALDQAAIQTNTGDTIAFSTNSGLFVHNSDGHQTSLSSLSGIHGIVWNRTGNMLAFSQMNRIWTIPASGGAATALTPAVTDLTTPLAFVASPSWTPDSSRLFFVRYTGGVNSSGDPIFFDFQIWSMAADGSDLQFVHAATAGNSIFGINVSPDGTALFYYTANSVNSIIERLDLASGTTSMLIDNASEPALSPSGSHIAFIRNHQVWVCDLLSGACPDAQIHQISNGTSVTNDITPSWLGD